MEVAQGLCKSGNDLSGPPKVRAHPFVAGEGSAAGVCKGKCAIGGCDEDGGAEFWVEVQQGGAQRERHCTAHARRRAQIIHLRARSGTPN